MIPDLDPRLSQIGFIFDVVSNPSEERGSHNKWLITRWEVVRFKWQKKDEKGQVLEEKDSFSYKVVDSRALTSEEIELVKPAFEELERKHIEWRKKVEEQSE